MTTLTWKRDENSGLDYLAPDSKAREVAVVLLHGYGADCTDLAPLAQVISPSTAADWFFPNGGQEVLIGPHMTGRAWFPIDMERLQRAQMTGQFEEYLARAMPPGFLAASEQVASFLKELKKTYSKVILGGFSQGSMISAQVALKEADLIDALILLSSTFVSESSWRDLVAQNLKFPILQSHGRLDQVLPFKEAQRLSEFLRQHTEDYQFIEFSGGHEIPSEVTSAMGKLIERVGSAV